MSGFKKEAVCMLGLLVLGLVFFYKMIYFDFVNFDDATHTSENIPVLTFNLADLLLKSDTGLYHPVTTLSYAIDWWLGGGKPWIFHLTNIIFHLLAALILFKICMKLWGRNYVLALLISLTFLLHPLKAESVAWITERKDVLSGFFLWLTIYIYLFYLDSAKRHFYIASIATFLCALASKASMIALIPLLLVLDWYRTGRINFRSLTNKIPFTLLALVFVIINTKTQIPYLNMPEQNYFDRIYRIQFYLEKFLFPWGLRFRYSTEFLKFSPIGLFSVFLFLFLTIYIFKKERAHRKNLLLGWSLFGFFILPYLQFVPFGDEYIVNDRYMYNALTGLTIAFFPFVLQSIEEWWWSKRRFVALAISMLFSALVIQWLYLMHLQIPVWKNPVTLWKRMVTLEPNSRPASIIYGRVLLDANRYEEALPYLERHNGWAEDFANLGNALFSTNRFEEGENKILEGLKFYPTDPLLLNMLGIIRLDQSRSEEALTLFTKALENLKSESAIRLRLVLLNHTGLANMQLRNFKTAESFFKEALAIQKNDHVIISNLGLVLLRQNRLTEAKSAYFRVLELNPHGAQTLNIIGVIFYLEKNYKEARVWLNRALNVDPNFEPARNILLAMDKENH